MKKRKEKRKLAEAPKSDETTKKITKIIVTLPPWMSADKTLAEYKKLLSEAIPKLERDKSNLERKIAELDNKNSIECAIYKLNLFLTEERIGRAKSDGVLLRIVASMAESYDNTRLSVLTLEDELLNLPLKQRRKLAKITRELSEKIEKTLVPIRDAFEAAKSNEEGRGENGENPPQHLYI